MKDSSVIIIDILRKNIYLRESWWMIINWEILGQYVWSIFVWASLFSSWYLCPSCSPSDDESMETLLDGDSCSVPLFGRKNKEPSVVVDVCGWKKDALREGNKVPSRLVAVLSFNQSSRPAICLSSPTPKFIFAILLTGGGCWFSSSLLRIPHNYFFGTHVKGAAATIAISQVQLGRTDRSVRFISSTRRPRLQRIPNLLLFKSHMMLRMRKYAVWE